MFVLLLFVYFVVRLRLTERLALPSLQLIISHLNNYIRHTLTYLQLLIYMIQI